MKGHNLNNVGIKIYEYLTGTLTKIKSQNAVKCINEYKNYHARHTLYRTKKVTCLQILTVFYTSIFHLLNVDTRTSRYYAH